MASREPFAGFSVSFGALWILVAQALILLGPGLRISGVSAANCLTKAKSDQYRSCQPAQPGYDGITFSDYCCQIDGTGAGCIQAVPSNCGIVRYANCCSRDKLTSDGLPICLKASVGLSKYTCESANPNAKAYCCKVDPASTLWSFDDCLPNDPPKCAIGGLHPTVACCDSGAPAIVSPSPSPSPTPSPVQVPSPSSTPSSTLGPLPTFNPPKLSPPSFISPALSPQASIPIVTSPPPLITPLPNTAGTCTFGPPCISPPVALKIQDSIKAVSTGLEAATALVEAAGKEGSAIVAFAKKVSPALGPLGTAVSVFLGLFSSSAPQPDLDYFNRGFASITQKLTQLQTSVESNTLQTGLRLNAWQNFREHHDGLGYVQSNLQLYLDYYNQSSLKDEIIKDCQGEKLQPLKAFIYLHNEIVKWNETSFLPLDNLLRNGVLDVIKTNKTAFLPFMKVFLADAAQAINLQAACWAIAGIPYETIRIIIDNGSNGTVALKKQYEDVADSLGYFYQTGIPIPPPPPPPPPPNSSIATKGLSLVNVMLLALMVVALPVVLFV